MEKVGTDQKPAYFYMVASPAEEEEYVKGIEEQHEFSISDAPISYEDLQDAYIRLLQGSGSNETFPYQEGDVRERRFLCDIDGGDIVEYVQKGHATNMETMEETGNVYRLKE